MCYFKLEHHVKMYFIRMRKYTTCGDTSNDIWPPPPHVSPHLENFDFLPFLVILDKRHGWLDYE